MEEDALHKIHVWASHGTMKQFSAEVIAKLSKTEYRAELDGDTLTCYIIEKPRGFLGLGPKKRKNLLTIIRKGDEVIIPPESADPAFVQELSEILKQH
ncbi:MAG: hypothetical protein LLG44_14355 [Chloroflexi bacterium]|nr:hypothetical protein [Chloroflexota bacterium]